MLKNSAFCALNPRNHMRAPLIQSSCLSDSGAIFRPPAVHHFTSRRSKKSVTKMIKKPHNRETVKQKVMTMQRRADNWRENNVDTDTKSHKLHPTAILCSTSIQNAEYAGIKVSDVGKTAKLELITRSTKASKCCSSRLRSQSFMLGCWAHQDEWQPKIDTAIFS